MSRENKVDIGFVQIHKKVIGDIAASALLEVQGVKMASFGVISKFFELFGQKNFLSVNVTIDSDNQVSVEIKVSIQYGLNVSDVARQVQDVIKVAVERAVDINLKEVNVNIQSIERGT
jgi:uncharacterized alkaline shock family protein YloU